MILVGRQDFEDIVAVREQVSMRELDTLGATGRPGTVENQSGGIGAHLGAGVQRCDLVDPRLEFVVFTADGEDRFDGRQAVSHGDDLGE